MDLCYESDEKLSSRLLHGAIRIEDEENYIYHIPGCEVHGKVYHILKDDIAPHIWRNREIQYW